MPSIPLEDQLFAGKPREKKNALVGMSIAIFNLFDIAYFVGFSIKYVCHISVFKQMMS